jgi:23S rRNA (cytosine1962-C5)-methyltransferase
MRTPCAKWQVNKVEGMQKVTIVLKRGREKSVLRCHPWVFSGSVAEVQGEPRAGDTVDVLDWGGRFLARGAYSPESQIRVRIWSWDEGENINPDFFRSRLKRAIELRNSILLDLNSKIKGTSGEGVTTAFRFVHAESDGLPGLIVDRYGEILIVGFLSQGVESWRDTLVDLLVELTGLNHVYERSDAEVRQLEGLPLRAGVIRGVEPAESIQIHENGLDFNVSIQKGHKTGFYLDQRFNRGRLRRLAEGREVLDCFSYTGGFAINAVAGGASAVAAVDTSEMALNAGRENLLLNGFPDDRIEWISGDVFQVLRSFRDQRREFDLVVLDPPKFAPTAAQAQRASRGYKDINLLAFKLLRPGGLLVTFSCSGGISAELFQKIVAGAALDAGVNARILERLSQGADHPVALNFPEGAYLKGFVISVV